MNFKKQKNRNVDIFIYSHIPFRTITDDQTFKVLTNSHEPDEKFDTKLKIYRDYESEDNLSNKNTMYNEYCGFYWIWKNYPIKKYVGMNHYRRMYSNYNDLPDIEKIFKSGKKIILNSPIPLKVHQGLPREGEELNNRDWYEYWHNIEDFNLLEEIIKDLYPEYMDGFEEMANSKYLFGCSMFIMDKNTFEDYCQYIFDVLDEFNERRGCYTDADYLKYVQEHRDQYIRQELVYYDERIQSRVIGYIAERALGAFLMHGGQKSLANNAEIFQWGMVPPELYLVR